MYIKTRVVTAVFRLSISALSVFASWLLFHIFGNEAWRLFPTWIMLMAAVYYFSLAFFPVFSKRRDSGRVFCPTLQGAIVVSGMIIAIFRLVFDTAGVKIAGLEGAGMILVNFVLPMLFLLDWVLFTKKGRWRAVDPFYWLALLICYGAWILLSAEFMNTDAVLRYPYGFLNYNTIGIDFMLVWFVVIAVVTLALGYVCVVLDFAMSGSLAKYIVLPHIKTIVIEEEVELPPVEAAEAKSIPKKVVVKSNVAAKKPQAGKSDNNEKSAKPQVRASVGSSAKPGKVAPTKGKGKASASANTNAKPKPKKQPVALLKAEAESVKQKSAKK